MDKYLPGLLVAALSGLTFLAYKHPNAFSKISPWLRYVSYSFIPIALVWNMSNSATIEAMMPFVSSRHLDALKVAQEVGIFGWQPTVWFLLWLTYLLFLDSLPLLLNGGKDKKPPDKESEKKDEEKIN